MKMTIARVELWGRTIGAVSWDRDKSCGYFEYDRLSIAKSKSRQFECRSQTNPFFP